MELKEERLQEKIIVKVEGKVDTNTAPELEAKLTALVEETKKLVLDLADVTYVSSAGLRVVLLIFKSMKAKGGNFVISHVQDEVMEVFDMTGFSSFLTFED